MPSNQNRIVEQAKFEYSPSGNVFKKKKKKKQLKDKEKKQIEAAEVLKPEENKKYIKSVEGLLWNNRRTNEIKKRI